MGLIVYLGLALTTLRRGHVSVDVLVAGLPPALKRIADLLAQSCVLAILALITWRLFERAETNFSDGLVTPLLAIEQYPFAFVMALGAAVASLIAVLNLAGRTDRPGA
jgi:TRAP-type C4-dicarboxylate transport system permease small subunit